jgi:hypothetical protein
MKHINTLRGQNAELLNVNVKVGGTYKLPLCFKELKRRLKIWSAVECSLCLYLCDRLYLYILGTPVCKII